MSLIPVLLRQAQEDAHQRETNQKSKGFVLSLANVLFFISKGPVSIGNAFHKKHQLHQPT